MSLRKQEKVLKMTSFAYLSEGFLEYFSTEMDALPMPLRNVKNDASSSIKNCLLRPLTRQVFVPKIRDGKQLFLQYIRKVIGGIIICIREVQFQRE